ncbi:MAG: cysS [Chlamydiales bacterium]|jgi:cysteinyl-tRNA synthetase|nr:cysS [Chlamydiales bacterium]
MSAFTLLNGKAIQLFNTETRKKEILQPLQDGFVTLYTCGPTVYDFAHIGNFRAYVFEDLLKRALEFFGLQVKHVMNLTDVDDKTIRGALKEGISLNAYTSRYVQAFFEDIKSLNLKPANHYPPATEYIPSMIRMIESLLEKKHAYKGQDGSIYYAIKSCPCYGKLSHLRLDELQAGASERVLADEYDKEHASDFVLWKALDQERDGYIFWESPFGPGRPGWHLECSAMAIDLLGETVDIHVGGIDNMFPHHENEIAQSEAHTGQTFVRHWMHCEHLLVNNHKMSKSLGNFYTLRDLLSKGYSGLQVRYFLLQGHYKTQLNFTFEGLDAAKSSLQRLHDFIWRLEQIQPLTQFNLSDNSLDDLINNSRTKFAEALADDLNISVSLAVLFDFVREVNSKIDSSTVGHLEAQKILNYLHKLDEVLGFLFVPVQEIPSEILQAVERRQQARIAKDWKLADELRQWVIAQGYTIEDSAQGQRVKKA